MHIIGVTGLQGSGKDTVADYICSDYGYKRITVSDLIIDELAQKGITVPSVQQKMDHNLLRVKEHGITYWMKRIIDKIKNENLQKVVIAGLRYPTDIETLKEGFGKNFVSFLVHVDQDKRYGRLISRQRNDAPKTLADFIKREKDEDKIFNFTETFKKVDYKIDNEGTWEDTQKIVDNYMS